eukprot:8140558-Alexandrium_andersonii.AAC.1
MLSSALARTAINRVEWNPWMDVPTIRRLVAAFGLQARESKGDRLGKAQLVLALFVLAACRRPFQ